MKAKRRPRHSSDHPTSRGRPQAKTPPRSGQLEHIGSILRRVLDQIPEHREKAS
jgi:hypothetical protein